MECEHKTIVFRREPRSAIKAIVIASIIIAIFSFGFGLLGLFFILAVPKKKVCADCGKVLS